MIKNSLVISELDFIGLELFNQSDALLKRGNRPDSLHHVAATPIGTDNQEPSLNGSEQVVFIKLE